MCLLIGLNVNGHDANAINVWMCFMANRKSTRAAVTPVAPAATIAGCVTWDGIIAFARTVTPATFVVAATAIRNAFPVAVGARNVGRTTNRRIVAFQNWTYETNASLMLDDVQLATAWIAEFPSAVGTVFMGHPSDVIRIIRSVRAQYNAGRHANIGGVAPAAPSIAYGAIAGTKPDAMFPRATAPIVPASVVVPNVPASAHNPAGRLVRRRAS